MWLNESSGGILIIITKVFSNNVGCFHNLKRMWKWYVRQDGMRDLKISKNALGKSRGFWPKGKDRGDGTKVFRVKLESKRNVLKFGMLDIIQIHLSWIWVNLNFI